MGRLWLRLDTPEDVLCGLWYKQANESKLKAMEMISPTTDHDVELSSVSPGNVTFMGYAFLQGGEVYRSGEYVATVPESGSLVNESLNLITVETRDVPPTVVTPQMASQSDVTIALQEVKSFSASLSVVTTLPTISTVRFWESGKEAETARLLRKVHLEGVTDHSLTIQALSPGVTYEGELFLVLESGSVIKSTLSSWTTPADTNTESEFGENVALLSLGATVSSRSSVHSSGYDATLAIDGMSSTQWSSSGDGNNAFLVIDLGSEIEIMGVGFWTRTMGTSAQISQFQVSDVTEGTSGEVLGSFSLADADQLYRFAISPALSVRVLRFDVQESSGGNTGAISVEVYRVIPSGATPTPASGNMSLTPTTMAPTMTTPSMTNSGSYESLSRFTFGLFAVVLTLWVNTIF
eukprot:CAMPEP_0196582360 /NCGR_PEP_ID=MMETSP1081-20130531/38675_1 /TAXON_ID=36882 /ORGANISM="Pyramimonas amylifera, Strain CCMP720" /LENGTH=407 /DNA_ID=CAMNT_0041902901 /DNA_START=248 /DNA_END=1471 /DNA_ORIENTATION=-